MDWPRKLAINAAVSASFALFDEDVGLVAVDEHGGGFSLVETFVWALAVDFFDVLAAGFRELGILKLNCSGQM